MNSGASLSWRIIQRPMPCNGFMKKCFSKLMSGCPLGDASHERLCYEKGSEELLGAGGSVLVVRKDRLAAKTLD
jgi:hypothetical protein